MLTDVQLISRAKSGDHACFEELISRYQGMVFNVAWSMSGNRELAEDITQEVFVKAYVALPGFRGASSFKTWLYRIAVNHSTRMRGQYARRAKSECPVHDLGLVSDDRPPEESAEISQMQRCVRDAIAGLPEAERAAVTLRYLEGLELAEVADVLGVPLGTVKSRIHYALKKIHHSLRDWKDA